MEDRLLEIAYDEVMRKLGDEILMVEKIQSELEALRKALPIHLQLRNEYKALADHYYPDWQAMQKRRMDREKLWRDKE